MEKNIIEYPQKVKSGKEKAEFLIKEITRILNEQNYGKFIEAATQETQTGQGQDVSRLDNVTTIIDDAIKNKIMQHLDKRGEWDSSYYKNISNAILTYGVLNSIIEELKQNQNIKQIIEEAKELHNPSVLIYAVKTVGGRKIRKSSKRHRKSNKKYRKGNKKHKKSIKKHRR